MMTTLASLSMTSLPSPYQNGSILEEARSQYGPDVYCNFLIDFMERNRDQPFFLWYSMALCHDVTDDIGDPPPFYKDGRWMTYKEMAESMDEQVGKLVKAIDNLGLRDNTLIIYTTDNGTAASSYITVKDGKMVKEPVYSKFGDREIRGGKGQLNDWGTRVRRPAPRATPDLRERRHRLQRFSAHLR